MKCPKCGGEAADITPLKVKDARIAVYACYTPKCGYTFKAGGGAFVEGPEQLRDVFRGATLADRALTETMAGEKLNPATKALFQARLVEYGLTMWFDGLKQGLLLGAVQQENSDVAVQRAVPTGDVVQ